jgi:hypothetical protein
MPRLALAFLCLWAVVSVGWAQTGAVPSGAWAGWGIQAAPNGDSLAWSVRINFVDSRSAEVAYPSLACAGRLERPSAAATLWREVITSGDCISGSGVRMRTENGALFVDWIGAGTEFPDINAAAILYQQDLTS